RAVARQPTRFRRKLVRLPGGRACQRRTRSTSSRRLSRARAARRTRRLGGFLEGGLQHLEDGAVAGTIRAARLLLMISASVATRSTAPPTSTNTAPARPTRTTRPSRRCPRRPHGRRLER